VPARKKIKQLLIWKGYHVLFCFLWCNKQEATAKSTARPSCLVGVGLLYDISREKILLINHFYVTSHKATEITQNNGH